ncbi:hypothetical protein P175DRAFT_0496570 [Aspergillus ochraceoroseus IBT 24754]|uniref:Uncharacterized protein n=1 Tax=Aspergillus ochraceoroseus IBT 24754 TaxID=1392256 RepID=A0A2T5LL91_9EURO|nr:uncharacterized protein P175DRAFT_0496570 [Aspergillus ochraceoroseus IBT 24754]PTU17047.1 hypothetical protein P175DRAFT_0496570 [Aspergillus ochraceoroseus IBT 24754]
MDLSSLEGLPIQDTRFCGSGSGSGSSWNNSTPHIILDHVESPVSPLDPVRDLPPRPASTDATPRRRKYPGTASNAGIWQSSPSPNPLPASQPSPCAILSSPAPRDTRTHTSSLSTPHQLVWLESEQTWVLTTTTITTTTTTTTTATNPPTATTPTTLYPSQYRTSHRGLSHSRSMEVYPSTEADDIPPPYEQHIYDQPLGPDPVVVRAPAPPEVAPSAGGSRWAAVARRINRTAPI